MSDLSAVVLKSSLIIDEQYVNVSEVVLYLVFSPIGNVASICFMKEKNVKKVFYAYVKFTSVDEAKVALDTMNYDQIYGKSIRILWNYKDQSMNKEPKTNITIEDLDPFTAAKKLRDAVWNFNKMSKCTISNEKNKVAKYSELAPFEIGTNAANIIKLMSELRIDDWKIFAPKFQGLMPFCPDISKYIDDIIDIQIMYKKDNFVGTFCIEKSIKVFDEFSKTVNETISTQNGKSFENEKLDKIAIKDINNNMVLNDKETTLYADFTEKKIKNVENDPNNKTNIYVKNLCSNIKKKDLKTLFEQYGEITSVALMHKNSKCTKAGLINYNKHEDAERAITEMNGKKMMGNKLLHVTFALTKEERQNFSNIIPDTKQKHTYDNRTGVTLNQFNIPLLKTRPPIIVSGPVTPTFNLPPILAKNKSYLVDNKPNYSYHQQNKPLNFADHLEIIEPKPQSSIKSEDYQPVVDKTLLCNKSSNSNKQKDEPLSSASYPKIIEPKRQSRSTNTDDYESDIENKFFCNKSNYFNKQEEEPLSFANRSKIIEPKRQSRSTNTENYESVIDKTLMCDKSNYSNKEEMEPLSFANRPKINEPRRQNRWTNNTENYELIIDDYESPDPRTPTALDPIMCNNNPYFKQLTQKVFEKVKEINPKWAQQITKAMLRNEIPILNQLLSDDIKFRDEVLLFVEILES